jgi:peptidoglycan pentaglycine glycine transferase (the first glycine)
MHTTVGTGALSVETLTSRSELDHFITRPEVTPFAKFLQSWEWGEYIQLLGKKIFRLAFRRGGELVATALVMDDDDRFGNYLYCPRGPLLDWTDVPLATEVLNRLRKTCRELAPHAVCLRVDPALPEGSPATAAYGALGFQRAGRFVQVERTWMADLQPTWERQLEWQKAHGMRSNIPRYLRRAEREGLVVRSSDDPADLEKFVNILRATSERKDGMSLNPLHYYARQFEALAPANLERVFLAEYEGKPICGAQIAFFGPEASYLYGGSLDEMRELRAPHYMHFKIMREAFERGCESYNFWGIVKEKNHKPGYKGYGYSEFKRTFGGYSVVFERTRDYIYKPLRYLFMYANDRRRFHVAQME